VGEDVTLTITMPSNYDITLWNISFQVMQNKSDTTYTFEKTVSGGGITIVDATTFNVNILTADTTSVTDNYYYWKATRTDSGHNGRIAFGDLLLEP
jgi:hypothetical protein